MALSTVCSLSQQVFPRYLSHRCHRVTEVRCLSFRERSPLSSPLDRQVHVLSAKLQVFRHRGRFALSPKRRKSAYRRSADVSFRSPFHHGFERNLATFAGRASDRRHVRLDRWTELRFSTGLSIGSRGIVPKDGIQDARRHGTQGLRYERVGAGTALVRGQERKKRVADRPPRRRARRWTP